MSGRKESNQTNKQTIYHLTSIRIAPRGSNVGLVTHWGTRLSINIPEYANEIIFIYTRQKRNAPLRTVQLSGRSQVIGQLSLYQCKGMIGTAALHVFCNQASKLC